MRSEISEALRKFERKEVTRVDLPKMVLQIADDLAELVGLSGRVAAGLL